MCCPLDFIQDFLFSRMILRFEINSSYLSDNYSWIEGLKIWKTTWTVHWEQGKLLLLWIPKMKKKRFVPNNEEAIQLFILHLFVIFTAKFPLTQPNRYNRSSSNLRRYSFLLWFFFCYCICCCCFGPAVPVPHCRNFSEKLLLRFLQRFMFTNLRETSTIECGNSFYAKFKW